jgi:hypothetical protein
MNQFIDLEYEVISEKREAEVIKLQSIHDVRMKDIEIENLKKLLFDKKIAEVEFKKKIEEYENGYAQSTKSHSRHGSHSSLNNSFKELNRKKISQALPSYPSNFHSNQRKSKRKTNSRVGSVKESPVKFTQECTPFEFRLKNEECKTRKNSIRKTDNEFPEEPYVLNVLPIAETLRECKHLKETPKKEQTHHRRDTSPRNSVVSHLVVPRSSKAVPLQSPIETETPYSVGRVKEDERGWSGIYKIN